MFVFSPLSFLVRWVLCVFVVFATYNTSGYSYYHWLTSIGDEDVALRVLVGIVLLITYAVFLMSMWRSMGPFGIAAAVLWLTALIWIIVDWGLLNLDSSHAVATTTEFVLATLLAFGVSTSHAKVRLIGQTESNYVEYY